MRSSWLAPMLLLALACGNQAETESTEEPTEEPAGLPEIDVPEGARVMFVSPEDGASITGPLTDGKVTVQVEMGVEGAEVQPAGEITAGTGHHHIIIDGGAIPVGEAVPADDTHIHFGGGQTEAEVALAPGEHTLRLQFADGMHRSYGPELGAEITVTVAEASEEGEAAEGEAAEGEAEAEAAAEE